MNKKYVNKMFVNNYYNKVRDIKGRPLKKIYFLNFLYKLAENFFVPFVAHKLPNQCVQTNF